MDCDICIIGAGPAGYPGALHAAREGKKVVMVERDRAGGTCLNRGCIPTKALRQCADALLDARHSPRFGVVLPADPGFDYNKAAAYRDQVTETLVAGVLSLLKGRKVELIKGEGRIEGPGRVTVTGGEGIQEISCEHIIVATGGRPCDLPGIVLDENLVLSSEGALKLLELPESLTIVGGGVIGCEWADLMNAFGVRVTLVESMPRMLLNEDRATSRAVQKMFEGRGISIRVGAAVEEIFSSGGKVVCRLGSGEEIISDKAIISVGRRPAVSSLGLEAAGVTIESGAIKVDSRGRTTAPGIWAAGDVIGPPMLAHVATHEMEVVMDNILGGSREFDREVIPAVVFTRPEVASVGLLEDAAKERGVPVETGRFSYAAGGKANCIGETEGFAKVVTARDGSRILGGAIMGAHASDLVSELAVAIKAGLKLADFIEIIHAHPTLSEIVLEAAADAQGMAVHKAGRTRRARS